MYDLTMKLAFQEAHRRVDHQIRRAISRARSCLDTHVPYLMGGKTPDGLDCSGLITHCVPRVLPEGVQKQFEHLRKWMFVGDEIKYIDMGDIIFFAEKTSNNKISHVGIVEKTINTNVLIIHSSEYQKGVVRDIFDTKQNSFRESYLVVGVAKLRPFLFRCFLKDEINKEVGLANRITW